MKNNTKRNLSFDNKFKKFLLKHNSPKYFSSADKEYYLSEKIEKYIKKINSSQLKEFEENLLIWIINNCDEKLVSLCIDKGINCFCVDKYSSSALIHAVENNQTETCKKLVEKKCNINHTNKDNNSPLLIATKKNNFELVKYLIENNAKLNVKDILKNNEIYYAAQNGNFEMAQYLIENGAKIDEMFSIIVAAIKANSRVDLIKLLIENGANVNVTHMTNTSPLELCIERAVLSADMKSLVSFSDVINLGLYNSVYEDDKINNEKIINVLIEAGSDFSHVNQNILREFKNLCVDGKIKIDSQFTEKILEYFKSKTSLGGKRDKEEKEMLGEFSFEVET